ncbi:hypothetical protein STEG23_027236 [Scotinomys teguina]
MNINSHLGCYCDLDPDMTLGATDIYTDPGCGKVTDTDMALSHSPGSDVTTAPGVLMSCFLSSLYILEISPLSDMELVKIFSHSFIYMVYYIDRLLYVEPSLHLWDKAYLVMVDNVFDVFLESVCQYFIEYLCIYVHELILEVPPPVMFPMTVTPLGQDQDCSLKNREPDVPLSWFLDPGGWSKTAVVGLYFIFPGICTLSLVILYPSVVFDTVED